MYVSYISSVKNLKEYEYLHKIGIRKNKTNNK